MFDLVAIGHVARDEFEGETEWRLGGTALYAAATGARLGYRVALLTRVGPLERAALTRRCAELGVELHALVSATTTTFAFRDVGGKRRPRLKARARGLAAEAIPDGLRQARAVVFGSIAHELAESLFEAYAAVPRVLAAQGYLRTWDADGAVRRREWDEAAEVLRRVNVAVVSEEDIEGDLDLARRWSATTAVAVTIAERGAILLRDGRETTVAGFVADRVIDPTGAGDAFCAGLALALVDGARLEQAARFANAVASFAVEDRGVGGLATRDRVKARMRGHASSSSSGASGRAARP